MQNGKDDDLRLKHKILKKKKRRLKHDKTLLLKNDDIS